MLNAEFDMQFAFSTQPSAFPLPLLDPDPRPVDAELGQHPWHVGHHRFGTADEAERGRVIDEGGELR